MHLFYSSTLFWSVSGFPSSHVIQFLLLIFLGNWLRFSPFLLLTRAEDTVEDSFKGKDAQRDKEDQTPCLNSLLLKTNTRNAWCGTYFLYTYMHPTQKKFLNIFMIIIWQKHYLPPTDLSPFSLLSSTIQYNTLLYLPLAEIRLFSLPSSIPSIPQIIKS